MRLMRLITECKDYSIMGHEDFYDYDDVYLSTLKEAAILKCDLRAMDLDLCSNKAKIDQHLWQHFESACRGNNPRWKLVRVEIREGNLRLVFADISDKSAKHYPLQVIEFDKGGLLFDVEVENRDSTTEKYSFEYYREVVDDKEDGYFATIEEYPRGKTPRCYHRLLINDGKYYIEQEVYNS